MDYWFFSFENLKIWRKKNSRFFSESWFFPACTTEEPGFPWEILTLFGTRQFASSILRGVSNVEQNKIAVLRTTERVWCAVLKRLRTTKRVRCAVLTWLRAAKWVWCSVLKCGPYWKMIFLESSKVWNKNAKKYESFVNVFFSGCNTQEPSFSWELLTLFWTR